jgi:hypothetical protein
VARVATSLQPRIHLWISHEKLPLIDFIENQKNGWFLVQNSYFEIWKKKIKNRAVFVVH